MSTVILTRSIVKRIGKTKWFIIILGIALAVLLGLYAKSKPTIYSARATLFPLNSSGSSASGGVIGALTGMGGGDGGRGFSADASISIEELSSSRQTLSAISAIRLPAFNNKPIAQVLIENYNKQVPFYGTKMGIPTDENTLLAVGAGLLSQSLSAKTNKTGLFEIKVTSTDDRLLAPVADLLVTRISQFYREVKVKKAKSDYDFTVRKMDSLRAILDIYDRRAIQMSSTTLFTPSEKIEYTIPKENLINDKTRVVGQYNAAAANREEALWRLQRETPILEVLDKPDPPYATTRPSTMLYAIGGFVLGCFLGLILFLADILYKYGNAEINKAIFGNSKGEILTVEKTVTTTAAPEGAAV